MRRFFLVTALLVFVLLSALATASEQTTELGFSDFSVGSGENPSSLQYLDIQGYAMKSAKTLAATTAQGDMTYSYSLELPPALLPAALSLNYSSAGDLNLEMPSGWSLGGIAEIRRPLARAYQTSGERYEKEYVVSAPGFSGTLMPSGLKDYRWFLHTSAPSLVTATYDMNEHTFTLYHDGVTWELSPKDIGAGTHDGTELWRVDKMSDAYGNCVKYNYYDDGRIKKIVYGGNNKTGVAHLVDVVFDYRARSSLRTSARAGFLTTYDYIITKISVQAHSDDDATSTAAASVMSSTVATTSSLAATSSTFYSYDLSYTKKDSQDLLTKLEREGKSVADAETIATFTYSEFDDSMSDSRTSRNGPESLGTTYSYTPVYIVGAAQANMPNQSFSYLPSYSGSSNLLTDFNRDGLIDFLDASDAISDAEEDTATTTSWVVTPQNGSQKWPDDYAVAQAESFQLNTTTSEAPKNIDDYFGASVENSNAYQIMDMDGDGYPDQLVSHGSEWLRVYYGDGSRFGAQVTEKLPSGWTGPQTGQSLNANADAAKSGTASLVEVKTTLMDMNGDGWLDAFDPTSDTIYYHTGIRGGGWGEAQTFKSPLTGVRKVKYTVKDLSTQYTEAGKKESSAEFLKVSYSLADVEEVNDWIYCGDMCTAGCGKDHPEWGTSKADIAAATACVDECKRDNCGDKPDDLVRRYVSDIKEEISYGDLNGDGLPDYIDATTTPWKVKFGNGYGLEEAQSWNSPTEGIRLTHEGFPGYHDIGPTDGDDYHPFPSDEQPSNTVILFGEEGEDATVYQMLLDVDGDGLMDLAMGKELGSAWYKNTGAGFETSSRALPTWYPDDFIVSSTTVYIDNDSQADDNDWRSESKGETSRVMMDINHDGAMDYANKAEIYYGAYPPPYLLTKVENSQGGSTEVAYRSLSTVSPAGNFSEIQYTPNVKTLIDTIKSKDANTNQSAETSFDYANGYYEDGVFQGFKTRDEKQTLNGTWMSHTKYEYELSRDLGPLPTTQKVYTDFNLGFSSNLSRGAVNKQLRYEIDTNYADYGDPIDFLHLLKTRDVTEYGEGGGDGKSVHYSFSFDDYGNLKSATDDGGGDSNDIIATAFTYVGDNADASKAIFWRIKSKIVSGMDPLTNTQREFSVDKFYYDGHTSTDDLITKGDVTMTESWAGCTAFGEALSGTKLTMSYERGARGEITKATDNATGISVSQTFGFGGFALKSQTNNLGQKLTYTLDEQGRVTDTQDDNGFKMSAVYDSFNRVTKKTATSTDGKTYTLSDATYVTSASPHYVKTQAYNTSGTVENISYALSDGFGETAQVWAQNASGKFLVQNSLHDLRGLEIASTHPQVEASFSTAVSMTTGSSPFQLQGYDGLGVPRDITRDKTLGLKNSAVHFEKPWQQASQDEKGNQTRLTFDAHHRVTKVEQGKADSYTTTAKYKYDPLNRVVEFKDGGDKYYEYFYDGAGRLRQVSFDSSAATTTVKTSALGISTALPTAWYTYEYTGTLKTKMTDATGANTTWHYDTLGRVDKVTMTDDLPSSPGTLTYTYAYDTAWQGKAASSTDPLGTITYTYDKFGRLSKKSRTYTGGTTATTPKFSYLYDLQGHPTTVTLPSGRKLTSTYKYGYLTKQSGSTLGVNDYTTSYTYNKWGLLASAKNTTGLTFTNTYTTPLWLDQIKASDGTNSTSVAYKWQDNSLLSKRTVSINTSSSALNSSTAYSFTYDNLRELTKIATPVKTIESYSYDSAGNPKTATDVNGLSWTYGTAGTLNQIAKRTASTGATEEYTFDAAGRMATSKDAKATPTYYYDGSGRLRGMAKDGVVNMAIDYDGDGNVARRSDGNPFATTPNYIYSFDNWRYDTKYTETDNCFVATQNGTRTWLMRDYDGHVIATFDDKGSVQSRSNLGAYGATLSETGAPWDLNSFHGAEKQDKLFQMGQRHLMQKDGTWLQPEPLLYSGLSTDRLADPLGFAPYRYARNTPTVYTDMTGQAFTTIITLLALRDAEDTNGDGIISTSELAYQELAVIDRMVVNALPDMLVGGLAGGLQAGIEGALTRGFSEGAEEGLGRGLVSEEGAGLANGRFAEMSGMLRDAAKGRGNFGIGSGTAEEANAMGEAWVGRGARRSSDGRALVSADGSRTFRPPSEKSSSRAVTGTQANFEQWIKSNGKMVQVSDAHMDIESGANVEMTQ